MRRHYVYQHPVKCVLVSVIDPTELIVYHFVVYKLNTTMRLFDFTIGFVLSIGEPSNTWDGSRRVRS